jgi:hypothetical protein
LLENWNGPVAIPGGAAYTSFFCRVRTAAGCQIKGAYFVCLLEGKRYQDSECSAFFSPLFFPMEPQGFPAQIEAEPPAYATATDSLCAYFLQTIFLFLLYKVSAIYFLKTKKWVRYTL